MEEEIENENKESYIEKQWTFNDGVKTIDFVLVWCETSRRATSLNSIEWRKAYETHLIEQGLELEHEFVSDTNLHYVKIHAPLDILQHYAEVLELRMPMKDLQDEPTDFSDFYHDKKSSWKKCFSIFKCFEIDHNIFPECSHKLTAVYTQARDHLFNSKSPGFFKPAIKARIVLFILERTLYIKNETSNMFEFGIHRLLLQSVYSAAYPLHDGSLHTPGTLRNTLYHYWGSFKNYYKKQPIDHIRQYFGVKIGLYFAWLGFYTLMLLPASFFGLACLVVSLIFIQSDSPTNEVCEGKVDGEMCPLCDFYCTFWNLADACNSTKLLFIFDNITTVIFAFFISVWAAIYLELWKRYSAEITLRWDLTWVDTRNENPRPEYAAKLSSLAAGRKVTHKLNFITNAMEPSVSFWKYMFLRKVISLSTVLFLIALVIAAVVGVILYHMAAYSFLSVYQEDELFVKFVTTFISFSAAAINVTCIFIFSTIYAKVAVFLTELELPRTQREFETSLTLKMYLLEFLNHYASIFYIAFFKGKFVGPPSGYNRVFGFRQLECEAGGCMRELTSQLAIIMIGKQAIKSCYEYYQLWVRNIWRTRSNSWLFRQMGDRDTNQWERDYLLDDPGQLVLLPEYLEMVIQYGFVTIFVSAFPLAPLFALINNILEIRSDAQKLIVYYRRPPAQRVKDIGVWFNILDYVSKLAIITNGFIIAFTSNFIPKLIYRLSVSSDYNLVGYMNHSMSYVAIEDLDMKGKLNTTLPYCRYFDYREPPWANNKYEETTMYWNILAARLGFFILFENTVFIVVVLVKWLIPDVPRKIQWRIRRESYLAKYMIISHESARRGSIRVLKL